jgi:hypothetical protein
VILASQAAQAQNTSTLLVLGSSNVIDATERLRSYLSLSAVAADFGTTAPEYYAAAAYFGQSPQPATLAIGRWAKTAVAGSLKGGLLTASQQTLSTFTAISNPSFDISIDGTNKQIAPASFATAQNLSGVAALITTALNTAAPGASCAWNANYNRFEIYSGTTGAASSVGFAVAPSLGSKTDVSALLGLTSAFGNGVYQAPGIAAETAVAAATLFDANFGMQWYALTIPEAVSADHLAVAAYIEGANNKHIYGVSSQDASILSSVSTTDIAYQLKALAYRRTITQYSSNSAYSVASLLGRILTVDYTGNNTVITLMYKTEPGVVAETLNATQIAALEGKNCNVFVAYNNSTAIIEPGVAASGDFLDIITGTDWLALRIQNDLYNLLYTSPTKVPQTDAGSTQLVNVIEAAMSQAVRNGLCAPGVWDQAGFGALAMNDFLPKGFYIYAPPVSQQAKSDRQARKSVPIQIAAKLSGAVHTVSVAINVSR